MVEIGERTGDADDAPSRVLGAITFNGISAGNGNGSVEINVGFTLRSEGILKVEALEKGSKTAKELVIEHE